MAIDMCLGAGDRSTSDDFHELERKAAVETKENMRTGWRSSLRKVVKIWNRKRY